MINIKKFKILSAVLALSFILNGALIEAVSFNKVNTISPVQVHRTCHIPESDSIAYDAGTVRNFINHANNTVYENKSKRIAFLTFDDGPNTFITPSILNTLRKNNVRATFFVVGKNINDASAVYLKEAYNDGNSIAVHSYSHNYKALYPGRTGNSAVIINEALKTEKKIQQYLGPQYKATVFRYPGGHMSWKGLASADAALINNGMNWIDWNAMTGDAEPKSRRPQRVEDVVPYLSKTINVNPSNDMVVILMHDAKGKTITRDSLQEVINHLKFYGYEFGVLE